MKRIFQGFAVIGLIAVLLSTFRASDDPSVQRLADLASQAFIPAACAAPQHAKDLLSDRGGNYFCTTNNTVASGVNYALLNTYNDRSAVITWLNATSGTKTMWLDHVDLALSGTAPVNATSVQYLFAIDSTSRSATAANQTKTPININGNSTAVSTMSVQAFNVGAMTIPASSSTTRNVSRGVLAFGPMVSGDVYRLRPGDDSDGSQSGPMTAARGTTAPARFVTNGNPMMVPPGWWGVLHLWLPTAATNTPVFEYEACWYEQ